jgi:CheY-like chemotaxis protein
MKALVVDDHALIRGALQTVLKRLKRKPAVFEAANSREAMQIVEKHPDLSLILLDINLPDLQLQTTRPGRLSGKINSVFSSPLCTLKVNLLVFS